MEPTRLGELQYALMRVLWEAGEATVQEVHAALAETTPRAPTTVATMLSKMEKKGVVAHRVDGRVFVYRPTVTEDEVRRSMVAELTRRLFAGDASALVSHLVSEREIDADELERLARRIASARRDDEGTEEEEPGA